MFVNNFGTIVVKIKTSGEGVRLNGHVAHLGEILNAYKILGRILKAERKTLLGRPTVRWKDNTVSFEKN
jgi:hypothetical protein